MLIYNVSAAALFKPTAESWRKMRSCHSRMDGIQIKLRAEEEVRRERVESRKYH